MLCRLWQLQNKMAAVGGEGAYDARLDRVAAARSNLEQRLQVGVFFLGVAAVCAMVPRHVCPWPLFLLGGRLLGQWQVERVAIVKTLGFYDSCWGCRGLHQRGRLRDMGTDHRAPVLPGFWGKRDKCC